MSKKDKKKAKKKKPFLTKWQKFSFLINSIGILIVLFAAYFYINDKYDGKADFEAEKIYFETDEYARSFMVVEIKSDSLKTLQEQDKIKKKNDIEIRYEPLIKGLEGKIFRKLNRPQYAYRKGKNILKFEVSPETFKESLPKQVFGNPGEDGASVYSDPGMTPKTLKDLLEDMIKNPRKVRVFIPIDE